MSNKLKWSLIILSVLGMELINIAYAAGPPGSSDTIGGAAALVTHSLANLAKLITAGAYVLGFGFAVGAVLKFKAHKDNPTQITVGTPIALIFIAAALIFLPAIFGMAGQTVFGGSASVGGVLGVSSFSGGNS